MIKEYWQMIDEIDKECEKFKQQQIKTKELEEKFKQDLEKMQSELKATEIGLK